jgi:hypothetical protein
MMQPGNTSPALPATPSALRRFLIGLVRTILTFTLLSVGLAEGQPASLAFPNASSPAADAAVHDNSADAASVRPFHIHVSDQTLAELRRRLSDTRWPDKETVSDRSQGAQLADVQRLVQYWATDYDWRKAEAKLNALPEYVTTIDGVDIQFIWVRSRYPNALPDVVGLAENPNPGREGITRWKASDALPPWAVGFVSGSTILNCSMTEPGHPCFVSVERRT